MEIKNKKLGRINKIENKRLLEATKTMASYLKGKPTSSNTKKNYVFNRFYNILTSEHSLEDSGRGSRKFILGSRKELMNKMRNSTSYDEEDIQQDILLSFLKTKVRDKTKLFTSDSFNPIYFYVNSSKNVRRSLIINYELFLPLNKSLDDIPLVNMKSSNLSDILDQDPQKYMEYKEIIDKLDDYDKNLLLLWEDMKLGERWHQTKRMALDLGINQRVILFQINALKKKLRRILKNDEEIL